MIGKDKEEDDCPFENHPWVSPDQIRRYSKKFNELTICVNYKRRYLGPLKFYNLLNKWKLEDLKSYTVAKRKRTPAACPRSKNGKTPGNFTKNLKFGKVPNAGDENSEIEKV